MLSMVTLVYGQKRSGPPDDSLAAKIRRFAPTMMTANTSSLSANDARALQKIIAAARIYDTLYLRQIWSGNETLLAKLQADKSVLGRQRLHYFMINKGPWSQLDDNDPFIEGVPKRPATANFYPEDMTKDEFNRWSNSLSAAEKEKATGYFYTIRRDANGKLRANLVILPDGSPSLRLQDSDEMVRAVFGATSVELPETGTVESRPPSSLILFDRQGKSIFEAP